MSNSNGHGSTKTWNPDANEFRKAAEKAGFFQDFQSLRIGMKGAGYSKGESYDQARRVYEPKLQAAMNGTGVVGSIGVGVGGNEDEQDNHNRRKRSAPAPSAMRMPSVAN